MRNSILIFILYLSYCNSLDLFNYPSGWLFSYDQQQMCRVRLERQRIKVNLTQIYGLQSEQHLDIPALPHYCSPQACVPLQNSLGFICLNYTDYKFMLFNSWNAKPMILAVEGRMVRYDSARHVLGVWNGQDVSVFGIENNGAVGELMRRIRPDFHPHSNPTDMHIYDDNIYFLLNGTVYTLDPTNNRLNPQIYTGLRTFPFQFFSPPTQPLSTPEPLPDKSVSHPPSNPPRSDHSSSNSNMNQIFANLAFPLLSLFEFGILIGIAYWCKWKVYKTRDGRLGIRPRTNDSSSTTSAPFYIPLDEKDSISKA